MLSEKSLVFASFAKFLKTSLKNLPRIEIQRQVSSVEMTGRIYSCRNNVTPRELNFLTEYNIEWISVLSQFCLTKSNFKTDFVLSCFEVFLILKHYIYQH